MTIEPFGERLIVKRLSEETRKGLEERSGIIIPKDTAVVKGSVVGRVIHCGPKADFVTEGDIILFAKYSGTELPVDRNFIGSEYENCLCMNEENILGKLVGEPGKIVEVDAIPSKEVANV
jgi:chaperonin GroES